MWKITLTILFSILSVNAQSFETSKTACEQHNQQILKVLQPNNTLYFALKRNEIRDGINYVWMDKMHSLNIKHAIATVSFEMKNNDLKLSLKNVIFSDSYYYFPPESRAKLTDKDRDSITNELKIPFFAEALHLVEAHPVRSENCGKIYVNLLDNACLPIIYNTSSIEYGCSDDFK